MSTSITADGLRADQPFQRAAVQLGDMRLAHNKNDISPHMSLSDEPSHFMPIGFGV